MPNAWSMSRTLVTALAVSGVNIVGATILLFLADLGRASWWHIFNISLDAETNPALRDITNGEVRVQLLPLSRSAWVTMEPATASGVRSNGTSLAPNVEFLCKLEHAA